jgi:hypothetical protein
MYLQRGGYFVLFLVLYEFIARLFSWVSVMLYWMENSGGNLC